MTTTDLATARPDDTLDLAAQIMLWRGVSHLPVVRDELVVGLVSEHDLVGRRLGGLGRGPVVADIMAQRVHTAAPDDDVADAAITMAAHRIGCVPIVEHGRLVGILTPSDILAATQPLQTAARNGGDESRPIRGLMTRDVAKARVDELLVDAAGRMAWLGIRHLPIVDGDGRLVGMISDRDVRTAVGSATVATSPAAQRARISNLHVADVMTRDPFCVGPSATLEEVARWLIDRRIGAVPVVDGDHQVIGIVSYVDVMRAFLEPVRSVRRPA